MHHSNSAFCLFPPATSEHIMGLLLLEVLLTSLHMQLSGLHETCLNSLGTSEAKAALYSSTASLIHFSTCKQSL